MFPFKFRFISDGQELGKCDFDLRDQDQVQFHGYSVTMIVLHCFDNLFPCQIWAFVFVMKTRAKVSPIPPAMRVV